MPPAAASCLAQATRDGMRLLHAARRGELPDVDVPLIRD